MENPRVTSAVNLGVYGPRYQESFLPLYPAQLVFADFLPLTDITFSFISFGLKLNFQNSRLRAGSPADSIPAMEKPRVARGTDFSPGKEI